MFERGNDSYRAGDFKAAAKSYQEAIQAGEGTAAVYFNLGNALLRSGQKAKALLAYERARQADPRSTDLRWNIGVVQSMLTDRQEEGISSWTEWIRRQAGWITINETAWVLLGLTVLLALAGWIGFAAGGRMPWLKTFQIFCGVFLIAASILFFIQWREDSRSRVIVLEPEVTLRYGPAFSETKAFVLHEGATAELLDESGDWWYVSFGKNAGWLPKKAAEVI